MPNWTDDEGKSHFNEPVTPDKSEKLTDDEFEHLFKFLCDWNENLKREIDSQADVEIAKLRGSRGRVIKIPGQKKEP